MKKDASLLDRFAEKYCFDFIGNAVARFVEENYDKLECYSRVVQEPESARLDDFRIEFTTNVQTYGELIGFDAAVNAGGGVPLLVEAAFVLGKPCADNRLVRVEYGHGGGLFSFFRAFVFGFKIAVNRVRAIAFAGCDDLDGDFLLEIQPSDIADFLFGHKIFSFDGTRPHI